MKTTIATCTFVMSALVAHSAHASSLYFFANATEYDAVGAGPDVALAQGGTNHAQVEIHNGGEDADYSLWSHDGLLDAMNGATEIDSYAVGARLGTDGRNNFIEVHQGDVDGDSFWYRVGSTTQGADYNEYISWGRSAALPSGGFAPAVAGGTDGSTSAVIEVHATVNYGGGPLQYRAGLPDTTGAWSSVNWESVGPLDDFGQNPAVAMVSTGRAVGEYFLVEVHQGGGNYGPLWFRTGTLTVSGGTIAVNWSGSQSFDQGLNPSVTICGSVGGSLGGTRVVESHNGSGSDIWARSGTIQVSSQGVISFSWDPPPSSAFDTGYFSRVSCYDGYGIEVHQSTSVPASLWEREFDFI